MSKIIGIDLGTTNSCVSILERGEPVVVPNSEGARTTPSMVAFNEKNERLVGQIAKRQSVTNPENTIFGIKRLIGRKFESDEVKKALELYPFHIVASKNNDAWVQVEDKMMSPPEISALVLQKMKETAEEYLGEEVSEAVITVPAYFDDSQRQATKDAGRIAGLNVLRIINEPTAAALAYGMDKKKSGTIAVFDLGGGTFDVSILEISGDVFNVKSTCGDTFLGGEDFDIRIVDWLVDNFLKDHNVDLRKDRMALQRLKEAAEKAKHELSSSLETDINLPFIAADATGPKHLNCKLSRSQLEILVEDLIERLAGPSLTALKDAGIQTSELEGLILVGGMTRMPRVAQKAEEIFACKPAPNVNPDEAVAIGASLQGGILKGEVKDVLLLDVTPLSLGVETQGGIFTKLIEKNTTIPTRKSQIFSTTLDNQSMVRVHVLQGERELAKDNRSLAVFELLGLPPAPRGVPQIEVTFEIDSNGIVSASAKDLATKQEQSIRINSTSGLSEDEINKIIDDAQSFQAEDEINKQIVEAKNELEGLLYSTERSYHLLSERLNEEDKTQLQEAIAQGKEAAQTHDIEKIRNALSSLNANAHRVAEILYSSVSTS